jgi:hypothetical protein
MLNHALIKNLTFPINSTEIEHKNYLYHIRMNYEKRTC